MVGLSQVLKRMDAFVDENIQRAMDKLTFRGGEIARATWRRNARLRGPLRVGAAVKRDDRGKVVKVGYRRMPDRLRPVLARGLRRSKRNVFGR